MSKEQQYIWRRTCDSLPEPHPVANWLPVTVWVYTANGEILSAHYHGNGRFTEPDLYAVPIRNVIAWTTREPENPIWKSRKSVLPQESDILPGYSELCWIKDEDGKLQKSHYSFVVKSFVHHVDARAIFYYQGAFLWTEYMPQEPDRKSFSEP